MSHYLTTRRFRGRFFGAISSRQPGGKAAFAVDCTFSSLPMQGSVEISQAFPAEAGLDATIRTGDFQGANVIYDPLKLNVGRASGHHFRTTSFLQTA